CTQKTAYEIFTCLEFRRVLFRSAPSSTSPPLRATSGPLDRRATLDERHHPRRATGAPSSTSPPLRATSGPLDRRATLDERHHPQIGRDTCREDKTVTDTLEETVC